jgi:hypothetical protein
MTLALRSGVERQGEVAEAGSAVGLQGEVLTLVWPTAKAPGEPLALRGVLGGCETELRVKTVGSKRRADGRYDVRVRLVNLRRAQRLALEALFAPP